MVGWFTVGFNGWMEHVGVLMVGWCTVACYWLDGALWGVNVWMVHFGV